MKKSLINIPEHILQSQELVTQYISDLARSLETKDQYTSGHSERVQGLTELFVAKLDLDDTQKKAIVHASQLHDIGKIVLDLSTLNCVTSLSTLQIELFKNHPQNAKDILEPFPFFQHLVPLVFHHHENFDGSGYPQGLKGEDIPLGARVISIVDSFDAMVSDRSYRRALGLDYARQEMIRCSFTQFDPNLVNVFLEVLDEEAHKDPFLSWFKKIA